MFMSITTKNFRLYNVDGTVKKTRVPRLGHSTNPPGFGLRRDPLVKSDYNVLFYLVIRTFTEKDPL